MNTAQIEKQLQELAAEVAELKAALKGEKGPVKKGWKHIVGSFAGSPLHAEAMRLGGRYRASLRPKAKKR